MNEAGRVGETPHDLRARRAPEHLPSRPRHDGQHHDLAACSRRRREAGYSDTMRTLEKAPWRNPVDELEGFVLHEASGGEMVATGASR